MNNTMVRPEKGSNFSLAFFFLPRRKREALSAVYGFCRYIDDVVDSGAHTREEATERLDFWGKEIERLYQGVPTHPLARTLLPYVREFRLPQEGFEELIRGVGMDLERDRYETFADLEKYLFGVAGAVGLLCVEIFGHRYTSSGNVRGYAVAMGNALQLTNILRDVGSDLERGRIYLPLEDIRTAGYSVEALVRRQYSPEFIRLMNINHARAKQFYGRARNLMAPQDRPAMAPAEIMAGVYEAVLDKIKKRQFRVLFERTTLPRWRKLTLAFRAWIRSYGIY